MAHVYTEQTDRQTTVTILSSAVK